MWLNRICLSTIVIALMCIYVASASAQGLSATLVWNPPTTNIDSTPLSGLTGYKLKRSLISGNYSTSTVYSVSPTASSFVVSDLKANTNYYFVITAIKNSTIESLPSNEFMVRIVVAATPTPTSSPTPGPTAAPGPEVGTPPGSAPSPGPTPESTPEPEPRQGPQGRAFPSFTGGRNADLFFKSGTTYNISYSGQAQSLESSKVVKQSIKGALAIELSNSGDSIEYAMRSRNTLLFLKLDPVSLQRTSLGSTKIVQGQRPVVGCTVPVTIGSVGRNSKALGLRIGNSRSVVPLPAGTQRVTCSRDGSGKLRFIALVKRGTAFSAQLVGTRLSFLLPKDAKNITLLKVPSSGGSAALFAALYSQGEEYSRVLIDGSGKVSEPTSLGTPGGVPAVVGYEDDSGYFGLFYQNNEFSKVDFE